MFSKYEQTQPGLMYIHRPMWTELQENKKRGRTSRTAFTTFQVNIDNKKCKNCSCVDRLFMNGKVQTIWWMIAQVQRLVVNFCSMIQHWIELIIVLSQAGVKMKELAQMAGEPIQKGKKRKLWRLVFKMFQIQGLRSCSKYIFYLSTVSVSSSCLCNNGPCPG